MNNVNTKLRSLMNNLFGAIFVKPDCDWVWNNGIPNKNLYSDNNSLSEEGSVKFLKSIANLHKTTYETRARNSDVNIPLFTISSQDVPPLSFHLRSNDHNISKHSCVHPSSLVYHTLCAQAYCLVAC